MSNAIINTIELQKTSSNGSSILAATIHTTEGSNMYQTAAAEDIPSNNETTNKLQEQLTNALAGIDAAHQQEVDDILKQVLSTTDNSADTVAALSSISIAAAKTAAQVLDVPLYEHLRNISVTNGGSPIPLLYSSLVSGGSKGASPLAFQSFYIIPQTDNVRRSHKVIRDIKTALGTVLRLKTQENDLPIGSDGAYSPHSIEFNQEALELILEGVAEAFPEVKIQLALNANANKFFKDGKYHLDQQSLSAQQLHDYYDHLIERFHVSSVEDPFTADEFNEFHIMKQRHEDLDIVGGEVLESNSDILQVAQEEQGISAVSISPNNSPTLSDMLAVIRSAHNASLRCIIDHNYIETTEDFIADLAVGCGCYGIKPGSPGTQESDEKFKRLMEITQH
ncbi:MAG: hypothetical protein WDZ82_01160 [Candidatus Paceibacterota bacterium]